MTRFSHIATIAVATIFACRLGYCAESNDQQPTFSDIQPVLENYCYGCHGYGSAEGGVSFDSLEELSPEKQVADHATWLAVWRNLRSQLMPPASEDQLSPNEKQLLERFIQSQVFKLDPQQPDPGRVTIRRLNREEYHYTILDMFDYDFRVEDSFPPDDTGYGFDTIGDVLTISPLMTEKYFDAAQDIVKDIVHLDGKRNPQVDVWWNNFKSEKDSKARLDKLTIDSKQKLSTERWIEHDGEYMVRFKYRILNAVPDSEQTFKLRVLARDKAISEVKVDADDRDDTYVSGIAKLKRGKNDLSFEVEPIRDAKDGNQKLILRIEKATIEGPLDGSQAKYPDKYERIFFDGPPPKDEEGQKKYARKILERFATQAFRRPVQENTLDRLVDIQQQISALPGQTFEHGIAQALAAILISPKFLFRAEIQPEPNNPGHVVPIDEFALASRLSYFLWSSLPDEELFRLAREGKLRTQLHQQVDRMLEDPKSDRFVERFVGQWLQSKDVESTYVDGRKALGIRSRTEAERVFNREVRHSMRRETEKLFEFVLRANRPATELLTADYTFLNQPLAEFYGLKSDGLDRRKLEKVELPKDSLRGGILTHGTFLVATSNPTRTSPVKRGLFVLDNLLGTPSPPAPPDVPELEDVRRRGSELTMRQQMELHREAPLCNSCHARMDPLGLALESFSNIGTFRELDQGKPIETAGVLMTGEKFKNVQELSDVLATDRKMDFYRCLAEKLLTFAIGRGLEYYDTPTVDQIVDETLTDEGRLRKTIHAIVDSAPFQKRRGDGDLLSSR